MDIDVFQVIVPSAQNAEPLSISWTTNIRNSNRTSAGKELAGHALATFGNGRDIPLGNNFAAANTRTSAAATRTGATNAPQTAATATRRRHVSNCIPGSPVRTVALLLAYRRQRAAGKVYSRRRAMQSPESIGLSGVERVSPEKKAASQTRNLSQPKLTSRTRKTSLGMN